jgi:hypothetical protein
MVEVIKILRCLFVGMLSAVPGIKSTNQFPNPPIRIDIMKILTKAWAVTTTL